MSDEDNNFITKEDVECAREIRRERKNEEDRDTSDEEKEYEVHVDSTAVVIANSEEEAERKAMNGEWVYRDIVEARSQGERDV